MADGQDTRPLLVCLPSVGRGAADLHALCDALVEKGQRCIAVEPQAGGPGDDITLLARQAITAAGTAPKVVFVGHAYGAHVARVAASLLPDRCVAVIAIAIGARDYPARLKTAIDTAADPTQPRADRTAALSDGFFHGPVPDSWLTGWNTGLLSFQRAARKALSDPELLKAGEVPVLDLIGAEDPFRPPETHQELSETLAPRVTVRVISKAKHAVPEERPNETADAMTQWLSTLTPIHDPENTESAR